LQKRFSEGNINCNAIKYKKTKASVLVKIEDTFTFAFFRTDIATRFVGVCVCVRERKRDREIEGKREKRDREIER
jgi:hypothetical protein